MRRKCFFYYVLMILSALFAGFVSGPDVFAQKKSDEKPKTREFGWSLERFNKTGTDDPKREKGKDRQKNASGDDEAIRVSTNLVITDVLVVNENGNPVIGLEQSDFIVKEETAPQRIELFSFGADASVPRSIVLIFFNGRYSKYDTQNSLRAAKYLVEKLAPQDKMAIVTTDVKIAQDFTNDKKRLKKTLTNLFLKSPGNPSVQWSYGTLMAVLEEMFDETTVRPIVVFQIHDSELRQLSELDFLKLPEGTIPMSELIQKREIVSRNDSSVKKRVGGRDEFERIVKKVKELYPEKGYGFSDIMERVEKSRATIYSIYPGLRFYGHSQEERIKRARIYIEDEWKRVGITDMISIHRIQDESEEWVAGVEVIGQAAMIQVAAMTGGLTNFIEQQKDAEKVYDDIFTIINNRYTIGYHSLNEARDGKRRSITIEVRGHPEYKIIGRKSYIAPDVAITP